MTEFSFEKPSASPTSPPPGQRQAPPRRNGWRLAGILLLFMLIGSALLNLLLLGVAVVASGAGNDASRYVSEDTIKHGRSDRIAILPISGGIDDQMVDRVRWFCQHIKSDPRIKGVVVEVNSPGGGITASDEIHHLLSDLRQTRKMAVSMHAIAASGGYYVAMPSDRVYAERTTLTGSIGVIWPSFELTGMMDKIGVTPEIIKSSQANDFKDAASPFKKFTDKDREYIRGLVNHAHTQFKQVVEEGRKGKLTVPVDEVAIGKIWTAAEARQKGLVDDIKYLDEVVDLVAHDAGVDKPTVVRLKRRTGLFDGFGAEAAVGKVELKIDAEALRGSLQEAMAGKLEYKYAGPTP